MVNDALIRVTCTGHQTVSEGISASGLALKAPIVVPMSLFSSTLLDSIRYRSVFVTLVTVTAIALVSVRATCAAGLDRYIINVVSCPHPQGFEVGALMKARATS